MSNISNQPKVGDSVITNVRLINKVAGDPSKGHNFQIELAQIVGEKNILALFNPTDTRINQSKPQRAWRGIEREVFYQYFNVTDEQKARLEALQPSSGLKPADMVENTHFVTLNIPNPTIGGVRLVVQIVETTEKPNDRAVAKINPSTNVVITSGGKPVYRTSTVEFESTAKNVFLPSDVAAPVAEPARMVGNPAAAVMVR